MPPGMPRIQRLESKKMDIVNYVNKNPHRLYNNADLAKIFELANTECATTLRYIRIDGLLYSELHNRRYIYWYKNDNRNRDDS
jgi:hypothetical protein